MAPPSFYFADPSLLAIDDTFLLGPNLLVKPVVTPSTSSLSLTLPANTEWFNFYDGAPIQKSFFGGYSVATPPDRIAALQRAGSILPLRDRVRRSSAAAVGDPLTLVVAVAPDGSAEGEVYLDDGASFAYKSGAFLLRKFVLRGGVLRCVAAGGNGDALVDGVKVERVVLRGASFVSASLAVGGGVASSLEVTRGEFETTVHRVWAPIKTEWTLSLV
jgi:mannosyl-oligosaccharide alpha-1,3-glucosidase